MNNINLETKNKKDFLSVDKTTAISSEGKVFNIGDRVNHDGDSNNKTGTINKFTLNKDTMDVIAVTEHGNGRISFLHLSPNQNKDESN